LQQLSPRQLDCLEFLEHIVVREKGEAALKEIVLDLSQSLDRVPAGQGQTLCILPRAILWHCGRNRVLVAAERLALPGLPPKSYGGLAFLEQCQVPQSLLCDMAGNAFPGTVVLAIMVGLMAHLDIQSCLVPVSHLADSSLSSLLRIANLAELAMAAARETNHSNCDEEPTRNSVGPGEVANPGVDNIAAASCDCAPQRLAPRKTLKRPATKEATVAKVPSAKAKAKPKAKAKVKASHPHMPQMMQNARGMTDDSDSD